MCLGDDEFKEIIVTAEDRWINQNDHPDHPNNKVAYISAASFKPFRVLHLISAITGLDIVIT